MAAVFGVVVIDGALVLVHEHDVFRGSVLGDRAHPPKNFVPELRVTALGDEEREHAYAVGLQSVGGVNGGAETRNLRVEVALDVRLADWRRDRRHADVRSPKEIGRSIEPFGSKVNHVVAPRRAQLEGGDAVFLEDGDLFLQSGSNLVAERADRPAISHVYPSRPCPCAIHPAPPPTPEPPPGPPPFP